MPLFHSTCIVAITVGECRRKNKGREWVGREEKDREGNINKCRIISSSNIKR